MRDPGIPTVAAYWHRTDAGLIQCDLCPHRCRLAKPGQTGLCRVRQREGDRLLAVGYGVISSAHIDPVEKKPLYHFHPGAPIFSLGGWGCNFSCPFCQNWTISQKPVPGEEFLKPEAVMDQVMRSGCHLVAYTYNEPLVGFEFVRDCCQRAKAKGILNVLVTNGYVEEEPANELLPLVSALNVDIKSMEDGFYRKQCHGTLEPVLRFCRQAVALRCHVEITNLLIPTLNDGDSGIERLAEWIHSQLGEYTPLHLSAYRPEYKCEIPATPPAVLERAFGICRQRLPYVYMGNVTTEAGQNTNCPACGSLWIRRRGYEIRVEGIRERCCVGCGRKVDLIGV